MKTSISLAIILFCLGCNNSTTQKTKFQSYLDSLNEIETPIEIDINSNLNYSNNFNESLFKLYKHIYTFRPVGVLYKSDSTVTTMEFSLADNGLAPFLITYTLQGNKIDSLNVLGESGEDQYRKTVQFVKFNKNQSFTVLDSTTIWEYDSLDIIIPDSTKIKVQQFHYIITPIGKIKKVVNT